MIPLLEPHVSITDIVHSERIVGRLVANYSGLVFVFSACNWTVPQVISYLIENSTGGFVNA